VPLNALLEESPELLNFTTIQTMPKLTQKQKILNHRVVQDIKEHGSISEFSSEINEMSRAVIQEIITEHGHAFIYKINIFQDQSIEKKVTKEDKIFNFAADFVLPQASKELKNLIETRQNKAADYDKTKELYAFAQNIGAINLHWA
jgi:hypothetical protein